MLRPRTLASIGLVFTALFWNGNTVVARLNEGLIPALELNFWRWLVATAIMLPFTYKLLWRHRLEIKTHWRYLLIQAVLSVALYNCLQYYAAETTSGISITFINSAAPLFTFLLSWMILRQAPKHKQILGVGCAFFGLFVILSNGFFSSTGQFDFNEGDLWMLVAVFCWSLYSVLLMRSPVTLPTFSFLSLLALIGTLLMLPLYLWELGNSGAMQISEFSLLSIGYTAIFPTIIAFYFWNRGVTFFGPNKAVMFLYLMPIFAAILGYLIVGDRLQWFHIVGELFIAAGFYIGIFLPSQLLEREASKENSES